VLLDVIFVLQDIIVKLITLLLLIVPVHVVIIVLKEQDWIGFLVQSENMEVEQVSRKKMNVLLVIQESIVMRKDSLIQLAIVQPDFIVRRVLGMPGVKWFTLET